MKHDGQGSGASDGLIAWLLEGPSWVRYRTLVDLQDQPEAAPAVREARTAMIADPKVQGLIASLGDWPGPPLKSHKSAGHLLHRLAFAADLGLRLGEPGVEEIAAGILSHQAEEGPFQIKVNINPRYGGTGEDQWVWMLCDAPTIIYALVKFGFGEDPRIERGVECLLSLARENGWPCAVAKELEKFRGPGRKADPCPYANLLILKMLALKPRWLDCDEARTAAEELLGLWDQRAERRPYLFAMGTHFARLKAPFVWYDLLHVAEVLTQMPWLREDRRLQEVVEALAPKADEAGRFKAESVWRDWSGWEFGQKREPSRWITLQAHKILRRMSFEEARAGAG